MILKTRITVAAVTSIILVAAILLIIGQQKESAIEEQLKNQTFSSKNNLWHKIIATDATIMRSNTSSVTRDRDTLKAIKTKQYGPISENVFTTYNMLSAEELVHKIQIADLNGTILYSAPDGYKGPTKKILPAKSSKDGKVLTGIELDDDGNIYSTLTFPVFVRGRAVGVSVYMRNLQGAIEDLKSNDHSDIFIVDKTGNILYTTDETMSASLSLTLPKLGDNNNEMLPYEDKMLSITIQPLIDASDKPIAHLVSAENKTDIYNQQSNLAYFSYLSIFIVIGFSIAGLSLFLFKSFKPLDETVEVMKSISEGDFTRNISSQQKNKEDEIGQLVLAMGGITENIGNIVGNVYSSAGNIERSAQLVSSDIDNLSHRTITHASALEETAASMEEMTTTVSQNTESAKKADELANKALKDAVSGGQVVEKTIESMDDINDSSTKIVEIIATINAIAFQTNLLALNAAVEAARAGEQGRGFAVVASEVRTLALRCSDAAKEIKILIDDSVEKIQVGSDLVNKSGKKLSDIVNGIRIVTETVAEINSASMEQASGIHEINNAVIEMDKMTQQNSAMIEKSAAASMSMKEEAVHLTKLMEFFNISKDS